ncbi:unnamed protein product [Cyprideis torosa]|uniref:Uncharacterized protein n=1 Tax=Cyprideis torosa TaxID=163714 RepID=A0A7R8ZKQ9_9CRUS|nr:unnamed protein product [Cyprideis torosa]CAG0882121.1 unnamed protein product [Cyprideis torosa]
MVAHSVCRATAGLQWWTFYGWEPPDGSVHHKARSKRFQSAGKDRVVFMEGGGTVSCVVVDFVYENGNCGLTLAGDNPVYVQDVKPGSPAFVAGVRNGDRIITVNGVDVQLKPHETVIKEIKSHSNVSLTLMRLDLDFRLPAHHSPGSSSPPPPPPPSMPYNRPLPPTPGQRSVSGSNVIDKNITPPQPANLEQQQQFVHQKENTLRRFLDHEKSTLAQLQVKLHDCKSRQKKQTLNTEIAKTEQRIQKLEEQLHRESRAWRSSEPSLVLPRRKESFSKDSDDDSPPPLPARNRSSYTPLPPPPPPPVPKHLDQSLMFPDQASTPPKVLIRGKSSSTSEMFHQRTKSNPDYLQALPESNSLIPVPCAGSGSKPQRSHSDFTAESRRQNVPSPSTGGSLINLNSSSGASTPPTSPPPLSAKKKSAILNFRRNTSENLAMLSALSPSLSSSGDPAEIMALDSEPEDEERRPIELFSKLTTVMKNNASLAAFLNYLMQYKDPSSLFFYLITDFYASQDGKDVKEMKKWVYEIYSTFLVPDAPLRLKNVEASDLHDIDQDILNNMEREEKLKGIFWKAKKAARNHLRDLLDDFKKAVLDGLLNIRIGVTEEELQAAENNKEKERDILERILLPNCKDRLTNLEEKEDKALALAYSLATVAVKQFNIRISDVKWAPYLAECPMFVSKDRRPTAYKFLPRKKQALTKGHKFQKRDYCEVTYCTHCLKLIWGIAPQGEHCQDCDLKVHKHCVSQVTEECVGTNKAEKKSKDKFPFFSDKGKRKGSTPGAAGDRLSRAHVDGFDNPALQLVEPPQENVCQQSDIRMTNGGRFVLFPVVAIIIGGDSVSSPPRRSTLPLAERNYGFVRSRAALTLSHVPAVGTVL